LQCRHPITATEEPAPPKRLDVVDTTNSTASLVWLKPEHDGGSRIRGYIVEFRAKGTDHWVVSGETKSQKMLVEGLIENTEYDFRVKAKNDAGISEPQGTFSSVVIKEPRIEPTADLSTSNGMCHMQMVAARGTPFCGAITRYPA
uniref:Fibronectin type-III domain-containing protein n=1 Tax=Scophthalmus maximus TaxID=52904 RepID=A0A8D3BJL5_SCOMX